MGRAPCCEKMGLKKGPWNPEEDKILIAHIKRNGHGNWRALPKLAGLLRCGKSCRLRWNNYLRPDIKRGNFTQEEEDTILNLHEMLGNRWSAIAARLPGRTDNEIKNVWHTRLKKRLKNKSEPSKETTAPETVSSGPVDAPTSPQASSEVTSTMELSTVTADVDPVEIKSEETDPFQVMVIDESFWSGMMDENLLSNSSFSDFQFLDSSIDYVHEVPVGQSGLNQDDDVDFWYDLYIRTGGVLEFSI